MKMSVILLLLSLSVSARTHSQVKCDVTARKASLEEVFSQITRQTGYEFIYSNSELRSVAPVDLEVRNTDLGEILSHCLRNTGLWYVIEDKMVVISPKVQAPASPRQPVRITGNVVDKQGYPIHGAAVTVPGTTTGVTTGQEGEFAITVPDMPAPVLRISFIGMKTREVTPVQGRQMRIVLDEDEKDIEEVVVTGIFTRRKEGFTGSATQVSGEEIRKLTAGNVLKALEILDPGFKMEVSNLSGSNPNAVPDFQMRGQASMGTYETEDKVVLRGDLQTRPNQPLFVLDGVIDVDPTAVMDLDPEQIESITLLKDAAATVIYGSNAANGVVVVETKAPEPGRLRFSYNGNFGLSWPDLSVYNLMNAEEKLRIEEIAGYYDNLDDVPLQHYYNNLKHEVLRGVDTYWIKVPVQTAFTQRHSLNIEGGDRALRYKITLGAGFAPGVMKGTNLDTKSGKATINYRYGKFIINNQIDVTHTDGTRVSPYGEFQDYALLNPYYRTRDDNGNIQPVLNDFQYVDKYGQTSYIGYHYEPTMNPYYNTQFESKNENRNLQIREALRVEYLPVENLRLSLDFTLTSDNGTTEVFKSAQHTDFYHQTDPSLKGSFDWTKTEKSSYQLSLSAVYNKYFGNDHFLSAHARYSVNERQTKMTSVSRLGFPNDKLNEVHMGATDNGTGGYESTARSLGVMFTINYMYKHKYALDYSMRVDASSEFGRDNRYAPFWSAGVRWNLDRENFIQSLGIFDELIFRGTYGVTGSQGFTPYQALQMYTYAGLLKTYKSFPVVGAEIYGLGNQNLKWQQTDSFNLSLDFTILKNLMSAKVEYYEKYTKNTLLDYSLAPSVGFENIKENLGEISNKGYEVSVRFMPYSNVGKQAYWSIAANGGRNKSKIEKISNALKILNDKQLQIQEEAQAADDVIGHLKQRPLPRYESGYPQTLIWAVRSAGIDPTTGREVFIRRDGTLTYEYNATDQVPVGNTEPKFRGSLSSTFAFRGFSATVAATYFWGGQRFNSTLIDKVENADILLNTDKRALTERWKNVGDRTFFKGIDDMMHNKERSEATRSTSRFVMDDNQFSLASINLSYRMDKDNAKFLKHIGVSTATISLYMEDLVRFSSIKMERGIDYPFARNISMSLNLIF